MTIWRFGRSVVCPPRTRLRPTMPAPLSSPIRRRSTSRLDRPEARGTIAGTSTCQQLSHTQPRISERRAFRPLGRFRRSAKSCRRRNKAHLAFVARSPVWSASARPCDAHHLKFAQPRALGRKVSDEFTVPLCREHHHELHRHGNEMAWWANLQIAPLETARELWEATTLQSIQRARPRAKPCSASNDAETALTSDFVERSGP